MQAQKNATHEWSGASETFDLSVQLTAKNRDKRINI